MGSAKSASGPENTAEIDGFEPVRQAVLAEALKMAAFEGWTGQMLASAGESVGIAPASIRAAFPGGVRDLLRYWSAETDRTMSAAMSGPEYEALKIREKVAFAIQARLDALRPHKEAARRAAALLALPPYGLLGARLAWSTADAVWRGLKDKSTDFNFYSKRGILTGVWTSVFARWLADETAEEAATKAFLDARIGNVMQIEKAKARMREIGLDPAKPIEWLAKLRYPASASAGNNHAREAKVDEALEETFPASDAPYWTP